MVQWIHNDGAARLSRGVLNVCPAVGGIDLRQASRRARAAGETQHRTGGRSTRNQDATAQNAHIIKVEPTRFRNQEVLYRSIPSLASSPKIRIARNEDDGQDWDKQVIVRFIIPAPTQEHRAPAAMVLYRARDDRYEVIDYGMRAPGSLRPEDYPLTGDGAASDIFHPAQTPTEWGPNSLPD